MDDVVLSIQTIKGVLYLVECEVIIKVKRLSPDTKVPKAAKPGDVAFDLYSVEDVLLKPGERYAVKTGIALEIPTGYEAQIRPRSGLAIRNGLTTLNTPGTIDSGYRGEVRVILINHGQEAFEVTVGMRVAQMAIRRVPSVEFLEVEELNDSERGVDGFGSTGVK